MRLKNKYFIALTLALALLVFNQVYIQIQLSRSEHDAHTINMAGKQRMYSQKLLHLYENWYINNEFNEEIFEVYNIWKVKNEELLSKAIKEDDTTTVNLLKELDAIISKQKEIINLPPSKIEINLLNNNTKDFLQKMDHLVKDYEIKSEIKLENIKRFELGLFLLSLSILLLEVILIFYPLIKKLRNQNKALKISIDKLENKKKELEQLAYVISHDIQEPLSLVEGITNRFKKKNENEDFVFDRQMMNVLDKQIKKANKLLSDLLIYTGNKINTSSSAFAIAPLIHEVVKNLNIKEIAKVNVENHAKIKGFKGDIYLVLEHILLNAKQYSSSEKELIINLSQYKSDKNCIIKIEDNGIGIKPENLSHIFDLFKRVDISNPDVTAQTGFGLAFCKKIIQDHDGKIEVESKVNEGSVFTITLPIRK